MKKKVYFPNEKDKNERKVSTRINLLFSVSIRTSIVFVSEEIVTAISTDPSRLTGQELIGIPLDTNRQVV